MNFIKKLFTKSPEEKFIQDIIKSEIQRPGYFFNSQTKRVLNNLEEHKQRNGECFYKLNNKLLELTPKASKKYKKL